jgi:hypothetical protein
MRRIDGIESLPYVYYRTGDKNSLRMHPPLLSTFILDEVVSRGF